MRFLSLLVLAAALTLAQSQPVATQPFDPTIPRPRPVLNGCTESAVFAIFNSDPGRRCLETALPHFANERYAYSIFCRAGRWGCCLKGVGFGACKIEAPIPVQQLPPPPVAQ